MGSRTSQLRNRQQVSDSSQVATDSNGNQATINNGNGDDIKALKYEQSGSYSNLNNINNNNNNNNNNDAAGEMHEDVTKLKEALHAASVVAVEAAVNSIVKTVENGNGDVHTPDSPHSDVQQSNGNESSRRPSRTSTLQRQASQIQSLAQRIRRSSSVRRFMTSFGKRKVSWASNPSEFCCFLLLINALLISI